MHAFVQELEDGKVIDRAWRVEQEHASIGHVMEAPYFTGGTSDAGWWDAVVRFVTRASDVPRGLRFNLPFDDQGTDVLGLCAAGVAGVTIARGRVVPLLRGTSPVLRDLWLDDVRLTEMHDFAVVGDDGTVIVACGMAPLLIGAPAPCELAEWLASAHERMRELAPRSADLSGASLRLEDGDLVEVRGIPRPLSTSARTINLSGWEAGYREAPPIPDRLIGDEDGTRLVIRRLG